MDYYQTLCVWKRKKQLIVSIIFSGILTLVDYDAILGGTIVGSSLAVIESLAINFLKFLFLTQLVRWYGRYLILLAIKDLERSGHYEEAERFKKYINE